MRVSPLSFRRWNEEKPIAGVVRLNHIASFIVNANHSIIALESEPAQH
jgi:hypothetical protein